MSAIRLRETSKGIEIRVDDEQPQSDEPVTFMVIQGHVARPTWLALTIAEAEELRDALSAAISDARKWR